MKIFCWHLPLLFGSLLTAHAQQEGHQDILRDVVICDYPQKPVRLASASTSPNKMSLDNEREPNNAPQQALKIPVGFGALQDKDVDLSAEIKEAFDVDWFSFNAEQGDTIGIAILATDGNRLDSAVSIHDANGKRQIYNTQHSGLADQYPPESPFPAGALRDDSALTYSIPINGTYFISVTGEGASTGRYSAQIRLRKSPALACSAGLHQILFLDFDGVQNMKGSQFFGPRAKPNCNLSRFSTFLSRWGIPSDREGLLVDAITRQVAEHFNRLTDGTDGKLEIQNSRNNTDTFGNPDVSRVIVGGTVEEFGISTIGLSEFVDPGNFSTNDTAVVLLDNLSAPADDPNSILRLKRSSGFSPEDAVVKVVSNIIVHEACHFLGCWHTDNRDDAKSILDEGGDLSNTAGAGSDGILGTADDLPVGIIDDNYASTEPISGAPYDDIQNVHGMVVASLAVGRQTVAEERATLQASIADLTAAKLKQSTEVVAIQPTPQDTRKILGLPKLDIPVKNLEAERLSNAIKQQQLRLTHSLK